MNKRLTSISKFQLGKNVVTIHTPYEAKPWLQYLHDAGQLLFIDSYEEANCVKASINQCPTNLLSLFNGWEPFINLNALPEERWASSNFVGKLPPPTPLLIFDKVVTKRIKSCNVYALMTERCYDIYKDLRTYCNDLASGSAKLAKHVFLKIIIKLKIFHLQKEMKKFLKTFSPETLF